MVTENNFPLELNQPLPRSVQANGTTIFLLIFATGLFLFLTLIIIGIGFVNAHKQDVLKTRGLVTLGEIVNMRTVQGKRNSVTCYIEYKFKPVSDTERQRLFLDEGSVNCDDFRKMHVGQTVPILYDPKGSSILTAVNLGDKIHTTDPYKFFYELNVKLEEYIAGAYIICMITILWPYYRERNLVMWGKVVKAAIIEEKEYDAGRAGRLTVVIYQFVDSNGNLVKGKRKSLPLRSDQRPECIEFLERITSNPIVLYDPDKPRRNRLYPPAFVNCVLSEQK